MQYDHFSSVSGAVLMSAGNDVIVLATIGRSRTIKASQWQVRHIECQFLEHSALESMYKPVGHSS